MKQKEWNQMMQLFQGLWEDKLGIKIKNHQTTATKVSVKITSSWEQIR
jgi:hypothetical protein